MDNVIGKNKLVLFSQGEYSDYGVQELGQAAEACVLAELESEFREQWKGSDDDRGYSSGPDGSEFIAWLFKTGAFIKVDYAECHCGSYGQLDVEVTAQ